MNVCILSMQRVANFGSILQSYSLKKMIEGLGHSVHFIDIRPSKSDNLLLNASIDDYAYERASLKGIENILDRDFLVRVINKFKYSRQQKIDKQFMNEYLGLDKAGLEHYDTCVIGSDEVFNCMARSPWGFTSQLFGNVHEANKVITYAASCGSTCVSRLPVLAKNKIIEAFSNIRSFSVRDDNTREFVKELVDKECVMNYDPVFVGDFSDEIEDELRFNFNEPYCLVYSYQNRIHLKEEINALVNFCKTKKLRIITLLDPQKWSNTYYVASPFEVIKIFKHASFVFTDTFHGTILSAKYTKRYAVLTRASNHNKLQDLITKLEIQDHKINSLSELNDKYEICDSKERISQIYERERNRTIEYLRANL